MKKVLSKLFIILVVLSTTISCTKDIVIINPPIDPTDTIDIDSLPDSLILADVDPLVGIYKGSIVAFEGDNSFSQNSTYELQVFKKDDGIIQIKGNGISYNFIILTDDNGVYKPHPSLTYVKSFSYDPVTERLSFVLSKKYLYIKFDGILK